VETQSDSLNYDDYKRYYYGWTSTTASENFRYTEFVNDILPDRLSKVENQINYYISKLAKKVDKDILDSLKAINIKLEKPPSEKVLFDPENLWS
jgi:hypothetical protein